MQLFPVPAFKDNYIWIMTYNGSAVVVDPGDADVVSQYLKNHQLNLDAILITHHHWDHTNGVAALKKEFNPEVYASTHGEATHLLREGEKVSLPHFSLTFEVIDIPGHTLDHVAYYVPGILFCGDTLFAAGCGRVFEGTAEQMYISLQKLVALPDATKIYCGHEYTLNNLCFAKIAEPTNQEILTRLAKVGELREKNLPTIPETLAIEKLTNPFLRCHSPELIANVEAYAGLKLNQPSEVFRYLREWKNNF